MAESIIQRDDPGTKWYLRYLEWTPSTSWGAVNTGANYSQGKGFVFNKTVSWGSGIFFSSTVQTDSIESHVVPISDTRGKVQTINVRNTSVAAAIVRVYFLVQDPTITVSWE